MTNELLSFYNTFLAILSLVALIGAASLTGYRLVRGPDAAGHVLNSTAALWLAWLVALVSTVGSLVYSELADFIPCRLCWFQRIAMYPLSVILLLGAFRKEALAKVYALPLALTGLGISIWHYLVQIYPSLEGAACDPNNPCSSRWVEEFGFISIPFMAGAGFTLIAVLLVFYVRVSNE